MLLIAGLMGVLDGIAAPSPWSFRSGYGATSVAGDLAIWCWVALLMGIVTILAPGTVLRGGSCHPSREHAPREP